MTRTHEERTEIYHKLGNIFEREEALLDAWKGAEANKRVIRAFQRSLFAKGSKQYRVAKLTGCLRLSCNLLRRDLVSMDKDALEEFLAVVNRENRWTDHTKRDYIRNLKQFYNWYEEEDPRLNNGDDNAREEARRLYRYLRKVRIEKPRKKLHYGEIITDEDATLLKKACENSLERALIAVLHETGVRVGELLGIRLRDIERKERHAIVRVDGKTGERRVPILQSLPLLEMWLRDHPDRENTNALLWLSTHNGHYGKPLRHYGVLRLLRRVMTRSGVGKRSNPHWYRHSRATLNAPEYETTVLCQLMGWELDSKQVRTYVHLSGKEGERAFKHKNGLETAKETKREATVQECGCGKANEPGARYCFSCGRPLSVAVMLQDEGRKKDAIEEAMREFAKLAQNPEAMQRIAELSQTYGGGAE